MHALSAWGGGGGGGRFRRGMFFFEQLAMAPMVSSIMHVER